LRRLRALRERYVELLEPTAQLLCLRRRAARLRARATELAMQLRLVLGLRARLLPPARIDDERVVELPPRLERLHEEPVACVFHRLEERSAVLDASFVQRAACDEDAERGIVAEQHERELDRIEAVVLALDRVHRRR